MIYAGHLTETLKIYKTVETQTNSGYKTTEEVLRFKVRAERLKNKTSLVANADEIFHDTELTFKIRYRKEIKETDIVEYENDRYRITSLDKYMDDNQLTIILSKINE